PEAQGLAVGQLHAGRGHVGIVGRARALIHGGPEPLAGAAGADQLVHEVLLLALGTVDHARADDDGAAAGGHHRLLPFPLAAPVDGERPRRVGLGEGAAHAVEDVVARVEDKARPRRLCGARRGGGARGIGDAGAVLSQGASRQVMARSLGAALPARMVARLSQSDFRPLLGRALPLITLDTEGRPHPMLCSYLELLAVSPT